MAQDTADRAEPQRTVPVLGPADAVLFDALDARLTELDLYEAPDGALLATTTDASSAIRLAVTDHGLTATETTTRAYEADDLTPVEQVDPAPEPDVDTDADLRTRLRGD